MSTLFNRGDVLRNKHTGQIVRLLPEIYKNPELSGLLPVDPSGWVGLTECSDKHWQKISYWQWFIPTVLLLIKQSFKYFIYQNDKLLGLVDLKTSHEYWKENAPEYVSVKRTRVLYGYLILTDQVKKLKIPAWHEQSRIGQYEVPFRIFFKRRLGHLL